MARFPLSIATVLFWGTHAVNEKTALGAALGANPIRRVVSLLHGMQKHVEEEGKKEAQLIEKFMCYCKTGTAELKSSISAAEAKDPQVVSSLMAAEAQKEQLLKDIADHKAGTADAKKTIAKATAIRNKEAAAFTKESDDAKTNIAALSKAIAAIDKGTSTSFLQKSPVVPVLQQLTVNMDMSSADRDMLTSFLSHGGKSSAPVGTLVIFGILKQMKESMEKELADATAAEEQGVKSFDELAAAKEKEIEAHTRALETKFSRLGETSIEIVQMKEDLDDTGKGLYEDRKLLAELEKGCGTKQAEWDERSKVRAEEVLALAEAVKILNDDDALDLFKKALPSASFMELRVSSQEVRQRALTALGGGHHKDHRLGFIVLALQGKTKGFEKVTAMLDEMVLLLAKEAAQDWAKKAYCQTTLDKTEDELKSLERTVDGLAKAMSNAQEIVATLVDDIAYLVDGIKALDKQVTEATAIRKVEHAEYKEARSANVAAKKLLDLAGNRLAKFYTPKLFVAAPKANSGAEEPLAFVEVRSQKVNKVSRAAPPPPPETWGAYKAQDQAHGGVVALLNMLKTDLDKEIAESEVEERHAQAEYEAYVSDSASKRTADVKALGNKEYAKAELEASIQKMSTEETSTKAEAMVKAETLRDLHRECDWLITNYEVRKEARAGEVDALKNARAVLAGADYSLVQKGSVSHVQAVILR